MIGRSLHPLALTLLVACALAPTAARADDAADTATARALGVEGVLLADAGKCAQAIEKLERAEQLHHAPTTATRLAECEIELGRLVSGTERLQRVVREPLASNAHPAFVAAVSRARRVLDRTLPRLSTLRLSVDAPPGTTYAIAIDDEHVPAAIVGADRMIDPGMHKILVTAPGFLPGATTSWLDEGETKSVTLALRPDPAARAAAPRRDGVPRPLAPPSRPSRIPAYAALGLGVVGLGVGIAGAAVVANKSSFLESTCDPNRVCPTELRPAIADAKTWATVSTVGFVAGGAALVTGLVLLLVPSSAPQPTTHGLRARPTVGAASVGLDGTF